MRRIKTIIGGKKTAGKVHTLFSFKAWIMADFLTENPPYSSKCWDSHTHPLYPRRYSLRAIFAYDKKLQPSSFTYRQFA